MIKDLSSTSDYERAVRNSHDRPVLILKYSNACNISKSADYEFKKLADSRKDVGFYRVVIQENRRLSDRIADLSGIRHKSPQVILYKNGRPVWNDSHYAVRRENILRAVEK